MKIDAFNHGLTELGSSNLPYFSTSKPGIINEEELYRFFISFQLEKKYGRIKAETFNKVIESIKKESTIFKKRSQLEVICRTALNKLVDTKQITNDDAVFFSTQAFSASQIDKNDKALYDGIGSARDPTIAEAPIAESIRNGLKRLNSELSYSTRGRSIKVASNSYGLLIKPRSNKEGTLAILIPSNLATNQSTIVIKDSNGGIIEKGKFTSFGEDGKRAKFSFKSHGAAYPKGVTLEVISNRRVVLTLADIDLAKRMERN